MPNKILLSKPCVKCGSTDRNKAGDCKDCACAREKARYAKEKEIIKAKIYAYRKANPDKAKESKRKSSEKNKEKIRERNNAYAESHRAQKREYAKEYRLKNPEKVKAAVESWYKRHPDAMAIKKHTRRARKLAGGKLSIGIREKLTILQRDKCAVCRCKLSVSGSNLDHIIPLAKMGPNVDDNIQLLCPKCNQEKNAKHPIDFMQSKGFLI